MLHIPVVGISLIVARKFERVLQKKAIVDLEIPFCYPLLHVPCGCVHLPASNAPLASFQLDMPLALWWRLRPLDVIFYITKGSRGELLVSPRA